MSKSQYYQKLNLKSEQEFRRFIGLTKYEFSVVLQIFLEYVDQSWDKCQAPTLCNTKFSSDSWVNWVVGCGGFVGCEAW